jgi:hypothetical protein
MLYYFVCIPGNKGRGPCPQGEYLKIKKAALIIIERWGLGFVNNIIDTKLNYGLGFFQIPLSSLPTSALFYFPGNSCF